MSAILPTRPFSETGLPNRQYLKEAYALAAQVTAEKNAVEVLNGTLERWPIIQALPDVGQKRKLRWMIADLLATAYVCSGGVEVCGSGVCDPDKDQNVGRDVFKIGKKAGIDGESLRIMATGQGLKKIEEDIKDLPKDITALGVISVVQGIRDILNNPDGMGWWGSAEAQFITDEFNTAAKTLPAAKVPVSLYAALQDSVSDWNTAIRPPAP